MENKEVFILKRLNPSEKDLFYNPLKNYCEAIDDEHYEESIQKHYEIIEIIEESIIPSQKGLFPDLYLTLTNKCNLKCKYCYAGGGRNHRAEDTTKTILKMTLETYYIKVKEQGQKSCVMGFMGGLEPTCAFDLMKYAVHYSNELAKAYDVNVSYIMATNGFYSQEISEFVCKHFNRISLSFDGPRDIQNFQRPSLKGRGSFDRVLSNALDLKRSNVQWAIHAVVTEYNVMRLEETVLFFREHFPDVKIVFAIMDKENEEIIINPPKADVYLKEIEKIHRKYLNVQSTDSGNFNYLKREYCDSVTKLNWFVSDKGIINTCMRASHSDNNIFEIGYFDKIEKTIIFNREKIEHLKGFTVEAQEDCRACFAKYLCGGGCPYLRNSGIWDCELIRASAKDELFKRYREKQIFNHLKQLF